MKGGGSPHPSVQRYGLSGCMDAEAWLPVAGHMPLFIPLEVSCMPTFSTMGASSNHKEEAAAAAQYRKEAREQNFQGKFFTHSQGRKKEPKPKLWVRIFSGRVGSST